MLRLTFAGKILTFLNCISNGFVTVNGRLIFLIATRAAWKNNNTEKYEKVFFQLSNTCKNYKLGIICCKRLVKSLNVDITHRRKTAAIRHINYKHFGLIKIVMSFQWAVT